MSLFAVTLLLSPLVLGTVIATKAQAQPELSCFRALVFAAPAGGPAPVDLILKTYQELVDTLGSELSKENMAALVKSENPFELPNPANSELLTLQKKLRDLEEMLTKSGWRTPEVVTALQGRLNEMAGARGHAGEKLEKALVRDWQVYHIPLPGGGSNYHITSDGRWLITEENGGVLPPGRTNRVHVYDVIQKTVKTVFGPGHAGDPILSSDTKTVIYADASSTLWRYPFENGAIQWDKKSRMGEPLPNTSQKPKAIAGAAPNWTYAHFGINQNFLFTPSGERVPLRHADGTPLSIASEQSWGPVVGTDDIFTTSEVAGQLRVTRYAFQPNGTGKIVAEWTIPRKPGMKVFINHDSRLMAYDYKESKLDLYVKPDASPIPLWIPKTKGDGHPAVRDFYLSPTKNEAALLVVPERDKMRIDWFELDTGKKLREVPLPMKFASHLRFTHGEASTFLTAHENEVVHFETE